MVPYAEVPHMKFSTAPGHKGRFLFGHLAGQRVAVMQGRLHTYEGWSFADVAYPVRVLRLLGAEALVVTNAAGAVNTAFSAGDIMLITDDGTIIRMPVDGISVIGRVSQGVRVMRVEDESRIVGVTATERDEDPEEDTEEEPTGGLNAADGEAIVTGENAEDEEPTDSLE